jgi:hypothetical protein
MKKSLVLLLKLWSIGSCLVIGIYHLVPFVQAAGNQTPWLLLEDKTFRLEGPEGLNSLKAVFADLYPVALLFRPAGADISDLKVTRVGPRNLPRIEFTAKKTVVFVTKTEHVRGDISQTPINCKENLDGAQFGVNLEMTLNESDTDVTANVKRSVIAFCAREELDGRVTIRAKSFMQKGDDYGVFAGPMVRDLIMMQTQPLLVALSREYYRAQNTLSGR